VGSGGTVAEMEVVAMRVRVTVVSVVSVCRDGAIDMAAICVVMRMIMVSLVPMRMAVHRAIGMDMFVPMDMFMLIFVLGAINARFAGAATASRTHFRTLQIRQS
jgi:uncharacterized membrane protein